MQEKIRAFELQVGDYFYIGYVKYFVFQKDEKQIHYAFVNENGAINGRKQYMGAKSQEIFLYAGKRKIKKQVVVAIDKDGNEDVFNSSVEAAKKYKIHVSNIYDNLNKRVKLTAGKRFKREYYYE